MRVIAGIAKGRMLKAIPSKHTRPTGDKVKEAIFSIIGPFFEGGTALDLFAGTGSLGIEAWSRGIERVIFVDQDVAGVEAVRQNVQSVQMGAAGEIYRNDAARALKSLVKRQLVFDLVFLDPPYRLQNMDELMAQLAELRLLQVGATVVIEHDSSRVYSPDLKGFVQLKVAAYRDTTVSVYRYIGETDTSQQAEEAQLGGDEHDRV